MVDRMQDPEDDPRHHTIKLREMLNDVVGHARQDLGKISEPKAQALFETTAEVWLGPGDGVRALRAAGAGLAAVADRRPAAVAR
jgi:hypothetical protein